MPVLLPALQTRICGSYMLAGVVSFQLAGGPSGDALIWTLLVSSINWWWSLAVRKGTGFGFVFRNASVAYEDPTAFYEGCCMQPAL